MQNLNVYSFFEELEKISSQAGALIGAGAGGLLFGAAGYQSEKKRNSKLNKRVAAGLRTGFIGAVSGALLGDLVSGNKIHSLTNKQMVYDNLRNYVPKIKTKVTKPAWYKGTIQGGKSKNTKPDWIIPDKDK